MSSMQSGSRALTGAISSSGENNPEGEQYAKIRQADANAPKGLEVFKQDYANPENQKTETSEKDKKDNNKIKIPFLGNMFNQNKKGETGKLFTRPKKQLEEKQIDPKVLQQRKENIQKRKIMMAKLKEGTKNVARRYINKNKGMKVAKLAAMGAGAAAFGMIGLSAGLAQDGYDDVLKYGLTGAAGGALLGKEAIKQGQAIKRGVKDVKETTLKSYYGKEYNKKLNEKLDKEWYKSSETKEIFRVKYGDEWKEKREEALQLRKLGITNQEDIERAIKLKKENPELTIQQAGKAVDFANNVTSREEFIGEGEKAVYNQMLDMVDGDKTAADKAMKAVKKALKLPTDSSEGEENSDSEDKGESDKNSN